MAKVINVEGFGETITGFTEDDIRRIGLDGFVAIRDEAGHLLMYYHPAKDLIEIQRRGVKVVIDLSVYRDKVFYRINDPSHNYLDLIHNTPQSATSAAQMQGGADGRCTNE